MVYLNDVSGGGSAPLQAYSKLIITANGFTVDRTQSVALATVPLAINPSVTSEALTSISLVVFGNSLGGGFEINTSLVISTNSISSSYAIDSSMLDIVVFADTTSTPITVSLPPHRKGRKLIIKDTGFNAARNNITLIRSGSTGNIEDYTGDRILATNGISLTLVSDGANWLYV
jgi:hypothetical protein